MKHLKFYKIYIAIHIAMMIFMLQCTTDSLVKTESFNEDNFKLIANENDVKLLTDLLTTYRYQILKSFNSGVEMTVGEKTVSDKFKSYNVINKEEFQRYFEALRYRVSVHEDYLPDLENMFKSKILSHNEKEYIYNLIWIEYKFQQTPEYKDFLKSLIPKPGLRTACNCSGAYSDYLTARSNCIAFGGYYCYIAEQYYNTYQACLGKTNTCPNGFTYDGANCYSGIHYPTGYTGFIYGNGFYTKRNCGINSANNCCPSGFTYDGSNCHWYGVYFPSNYQAFIYNNCFYLVPNCQ